MVDRDTLVAGAVLAGATVLAGVPTYALVTLALDALVDALTAGSAGANGLPSAAFAAVVAAYVAVEVAALQLHGRAALWRGSRRQVLTRHAVLSLVVLVGLVAAGQFALTAASWALDAAFDGYRLVAATAGLVGAAVLVVVVRSLAAGLAGYRRTAGR